MSYTLAVSNGSASTLCATGVMVRDLPPSGALYVSDNGAGAYNSSTGERAVGTLAVGQSVNLTINVTAAATGATLFDWDAQAWTAGSTSISSPVNLPIVSLSPGRLMVSACCQH